MWKFITLAYILFVFVQTCACETRIIGGTEVPFSTFYPYIGSLQLDGIHQCGSGLVSPRVLVTAAHCIRQSAESYKVRLGSKYCYKGGILVQVSNLVRHSAYNYNTAENDIALIILSKPVKYSPSIRPVNLPQNDDVVRGIGDVVGWGTTRKDDYDEVSLVLKQIKQAVVDLETCKSLYPPNSITDQMFCAGSPFQIEEDACTGDSGGPLVIRGVLVGVVSWGLGCANPKYPGIFTKVGSYLTFINTYIEMTENSNVDNHYSKPISIINPFFTEKPIH